MTLYGLFLSKAHCIKSLLEICWFYQFVLLERLKEILAWYLHMEGGGSNEIHERCV